MIRYTQCDSCYNNKHVYSKSEPTPDSDLLYLSDERFAYVPQWIIDLCNGVICEYPVCCIMDYVEKAKKNIRPALVSSVYRNHYFNHISAEDNYKRLTQIEKEFVKAKRCDYVLPWL